MLNDKITIIVNLQYRKGFLVGKKEWKYFIILSHLMQIIIKVLCEQTRELTHDFLDYV